MLRPARMLILSAFFFSLPFGSSAQIADGIIDGSCPAYDVRGVQITLQAPSLPASLGTPVPFTAAIQNANDFPIAKNSLVIRIISSDGSVIDQFAAKNNISLRKGQSISVPFTWLAPVYGRAGAYTVHAYLIPENGFYVGGVAGADSVPADTAHLTLAGEAGQYIAFDPSSIVVDGTTIRARIKNTLSTGISLPIVWKVYAGPSVTVSEPLETRTQTIIISPGKDASVSFTANDAEGPLYQVSATLEWRGTRSIALGWILNDTTTETDIHLAALSNFAQGMNTTQAHAVGCVGTTFAEAADDTDADDEASSSEPLLFPKKLLLEVRSSDGDILGSATEEIPASGLVGFDRRISLTHTMPNTLELRASILGADGRVERLSKIAYTCADFGVDACATRTESDSTTFSLDLRSSLWIVGGIALLIIAGVSIEISYKRKHPHILQ